MKKHFVARADKLSEDVISKILNTAYSALWQIPDKTPFESSAMEATAFLIFHLEKEEK